METVAGDTPLSSATSRRVTAVLFTFRRVKNVSEIADDDGAGGVNIFITGGAGRLAVRGGDVGELFGDACNQTLARRKGQVRALQSISNIKIAYTTKESATAQARINNLGLPFPKAANTRPAMS